MKNIIGILTVLILTLTACEAIDKLTQFEMDYDETVVISSPLLFNLPIDIFTPDMETDSESEFAINNTNKDLIEQIILKKLIINHTAPSNGDFSFLKSIEVFLSAEGLPEIKIAWKNDIPSDIGKEIILDTSGDDLQEYIKKDDFKLRLNNVTDETFSGDQTIDIHTTFFVDAEILGI